MDDGFIKILDNLDELIHEVLKNGDTLTTPTEGQMLINMSGVSINAKPRRDGRYQGYVKNDDGKRYFYGKSIDEVAIKIKIYLQEAKTPKRKEYKKNSPTFGEYTEKWLEIYKKPNLKPSSIVNISNSLKPALTQFANCKIDKISTDDIQNLLLSIKAERMRDMCKTNLNQLFTKALKNGIIKTNPCEGIEIKAYQYKHKEGLTIEEQKSFLNYTANTKYSLLWRLLLSTGIRIGEALALLKSDIDFQNCTISINKDVVFINGERIEQPPKTAAAIRTLPLPQNICEELFKIETDILFPYTYNAVRIAIQKIAKQTGINVSAHVLRHTYSDRLEEAGIPPKVKQYLLGHTKLDITQNTYTEAQKHYIEAHAENIRKLF